MGETDLKCRVCWEDKDRKTCVKLTSKWEGESLKTIKDVIGLCVPWMSIQDESFICKPCLWHLKSAYIFIERCLKTENILNEASNSDKRQVRLEDIWKEELKSWTPIDESFEERSEDINQSLVNTFEDYAEDNQIIVEHISIECETPAETTFSEHDYYVKTDPEIQVDISENRKDKSHVEIRKNGKSEKDTGTYDSSILRTILLDHKKDNVLDIRDDECRKSIDSLFNESLFEDTDSLESCDSDSGNKKENLNNLSRKNDISYDNPPSQYRNKLTELLDIAPVDVWFVTAHCEMTSEQENELVREGVNILNMSTDPENKKRTIFLGRNLILGYNKTCVECGLAFYSRSDYLDHLIVHQREGTISQPIEGFIDQELQTHTFACTKCDKSFRSQKHLLDHIELFKNEDKCVFKCTTCNKEFNSRLGLQQHENDSCIYRKCNVCSEKFTKEEFIIHCDEVHTNYLCQECGKSFYENGHLLAHISKVHKGKSCMCHECGQLLGHPKTLAHHIEARHGEKIYMCDKCPRKFSAKAHLRKHYQIHLERKKWQCEKCGRTYLKRDNLKEHERMHLGIYSFVCPTCHEKFLTRGHLKSHVRIHDKYSQNTCSICKKSFSKKGRLALHEFAGHDENGKSLEILQIKRRFREIKSVDTYQWICKICNKLLMNKLRLEEHYKVHLNLREYKCNICGLICQSYATLRKHLLRHTDPNFELSCNICHVHKSSKLELENHMVETHKNLKYKCSLCPEMFGRKHLLASHEAIVHKEENYKKQMILEALQQEPILVPKNNKQLTNGAGGLKKGSKMEHLEVDINKFFNKFVLQKNDSDNSQDGFEDTTSAGQSFRNIQEHQISPDPTVEENVVILSNEYQVDEETRGCRILEEELQLSHDSLAESTSRQ